jgi:GDP-4-dehydro-6-deoxy-D-mannose reductase
VRVLVTGGSGFVGQHLIRELLSTGHEVFGSTNGKGPPLGGILTEEERASVQWFPMDVTSEASLAEGITHSRPQAVYHLAAQSSPRESLDTPLATWDVNATGTLRLLEELRRQEMTGVRVLLVSSAEVYGAVPEDEQPIAETRPMSPGTPYGASKAAAEMVAFQAVFRGTAEVVVARSFNHTGPGQDTRFALPNLTHQLVEMSEGDRPPVLSVGNLSARRDFLDVRDVTRAYRLLVEKGEPGWAYNVCSGRAQPFSELVEKLVSISGTGARLEVDPSRLRFGDVPLLLGDPSRLHALGWRPTHTIEETLGDLFSFMKRQYASGMVKPKA